MDGARSHLSFTLSQMHLAHSKSPPSKITSKPLSGKRVYHFDFSYTGSFRLLECNQYNVSLV